jgi:abnormal spindle-like microcephaly-associated protein
MHWRECSYHQSGTFPRSRSFRLFCAAPSVPLQEYSYKIINLATDLRDGVRLTHLIELLLSPASVARKSDDITVKLSTGEIFTDCPEHRDSWILSHHLKFPSAARSQKLYNVEIALNALSGARGVCNVAKGLKADEIVDGHRRKRLGFSGLS